MLGMKLVIVVSPLNVALRCDMSAVGVLGGGCGTREMVGRNPARHACCVPAQSDNSRDNRRFPSPTFSNLGAKRTQPLKSGDSPHLVFASLGNDHFWNPNGMNKTKQRGRCTMAPLFTFKEETCGKRSRSLCFLLPS
jgi:hypothetical protein